MNWSKLEKSKITVFQSEVNKCVNLFANANDWSTRTDLIYSIQEKLDDIDNFMKRIEDDNLMNLFEIQKQKLQHCLDPTINISHHSPVHGNTSRIPFSPNQSSQLDSNLDFESDMQLPNSKIPTRQHATSQSKYISRRQSYSHPILGYKSSNIKPPTTEEKKKKHTYTWQKDSNNNYNNTNKDKDIIRINSSTFQPTSEKGVYMNGNKTNFGNYLDLEIVFTEDELKSFLSRKNNAKKQDYSNKDNLMAKTSINKCTPYIDPNKIQLKLRTTSNSDQYEHDKLIIYFVQKCFLKKTCDVTDSVKKALSKTYLNLSADGIFSEKAPKVEFNELNRIEYLFDYIMQKKHNQNGKPAIDTGADWQKNTKGFGLKLLQKFGFKGRLGANEDGVSGTIEVVNRPVGQGLGFGDFVEASSLKANKKLAAEWKGVEYVEEKEEEIETTKSKKRQISLVEVITKSQSWKKGKDNSKEKVFYTASEFLNRNDNKDEILSNKHVIVDMRGKETRILTDLLEINKDNNELSISETINNKTMFGEELIYNINLMVDLVDKDVNNCSINLKNESFIYNNSLVSSKHLESQLQKDNVVLEKLDNLMAIFNKIKITLQNSPSSLTIESIVSLFSTLYNNFTEEFRLYSLLSLLPFLTSMVISKYFINWNPLLEPSLPITVLLSSFNELITFFNNNNEKDLAMQTSKILENISDSLFTPMLRSVLINDWNVFEPFNCIELWLNLKQLLPKSNQIEESIIIPKLTTAVENWIPSLDDKALNYWILPWVKILKTKLNGVYPTIRRKISQALKSWNPLEDTAITIIKPWQHIFDSLSMENLLIRSIIPKLVLSLRTFEINPNNQQLPVFYSFIKWHNVIPNCHFISLFIGEFFVKWILTLCIWLNSNPNLVEVFQWYSSWKNLLNQIDNFNILFLDMEVLKCYNFSLNMLNLSINIKENENNKINNDGNIKELNNILELLKIEVDNINYFKILEIKKYKNKVNNVVKENQINKMNSNANSSISYIEYVETFALNNNIDFIPKLGKSYQDHPLYMFGSHICYVDQNVLYYSDNTSSNNINKWNPISLEELLLLEGK